jgi:hypothetical protein
MGALFSWINVVLLSSVLPLYLFEDLRRCRDHAVAAPQRIEGEGGVEM